jgi:hypothetical protein
LLGGHIITIRLAGRAYHHYQTCWEGISSLSDFLGGHIITIRIAGRAYHHYQTYWESISSLSDLLGGHIITIRLAGRAYHHYETCWDGILSLSDLLVEGSLDSDNEQTYDETPGFGRSLETLALEVCNIARIHTSDVRLVIKKSTTLTTATQVLQK